MKITDIRIDVIKRELPATGLDSDLGRFSGTTEQGVLRMTTDDGIEGNCFVGDFRTGGHRQFDQILNILKPEHMGRDAGEREWLGDRLSIRMPRRGPGMAWWAPVDLAVGANPGERAGWRV